MGEVEIGLVGRLIGIGLVGEIEGEAAGVEFKELELPVLGVVEG